MLPTIQPYPSIFNYFMAATKQTSLPTQRELSLVCRHTPSAVKEGSLTTQNTAERDEGTGRDAQQVERGVLLGRE